MSAEEDHGGSKPHHEASSRWRGRPVVAGLVLGVALAGVSAIAVAYRPDPPAVTAAGDGPRAPTFEVTDLRDESRTIALTDFRGDPVVLNFWASWCVPCRKEMPAFANVHRRLGKQVRFVGMNHQDSRDAALDLLAKTGVRHPSGFDPEGKVARAYGLRGMPTTVFISPDGRILATRAGEMSEKELESALAELFDVHARPDERR